MTNLRCFIGSFGSGKSLSMLENGLKLANQTEKKIVANFPINLKWAREYCIQNNLKWLARCLRVVYVDVNVKGVDAIFIPNSVVLFDELGIYLDSQLWEQRKKSGYSKVIPTLRHHNIHLLCTFQYLEQVDKKVRENAQLFILCKGSSLRYDKKLKAPRMLTRCDFYLPRDKFWQFENNPMIMSGGFKLWIRSLKVEYKLLLVDWFFQECRNLISLFRYFFKWLQHSRNKRFNWHRIECNHIILFNSYSSIQDYGGSVISKVKLRPVFWNPDISISMFRRRTRG